MYWNIFLVELSQIEVKICLILDFLVSVSKEMVNSCFPADDCVSAMLKMTPQIFNTVTHFTEYFQEVMSKRRMNFMCKK